MGHRKEAGKLTKPPNEEPLPKRLPLRSLDGKIDSDTEERIGKPVIRRGFSGNDSSQIDRHVLMCILSTCGRRRLHFTMPIYSWERLELTSYSGGDYRISWGEAGGYGQTGDKAE